MPNSRHRSIAARALNWLGPAAQQTAGKLDQMIAAGASPKELTQYVFDTHGCKNCHTIGHDGKLGFTTKGKECHRVFLLIFHDR